MCRSLERNSRQGRIPLKLDFFLFMSALFVGCCCYLNLSLLNYLPCQTIITMNSSNNNNNPVKEQFERIEQSMEKIANSLTKMENLSHVELSEKKKKHDGTTLWKNEDKAAIPAHAKVGIDPIYIQLFYEAQKRSQTEYPLSHQQGEAGIVIGPTEGKFKYTVQALQNGKRIRSILSSSKKKKKSFLQLDLAFMTSPVHLEILEKLVVTTTTTRCNKLTEGILADFPKTANVTLSEAKEACRLWSDESLFDLVIPTTEAPYKGNDNHTVLSQGSSHYWLKALGGYRLAPYTHTLFLDSDSYPCPGLENLFQLTKPTDPNFGKYWQQSTTGAGDLAIGMDQFANWQNQEWIPGDPSIIGEEVSRFAERNTGAVLWNFERSDMSHTLAQFVPLVAEHIYNHVASPDKKVHNDQVAFRVALYLFRRFQPNFVEHQIPMHTSCRTYPGLEEAGTDGFLNGMYPLTKDGSYCDECSCTPCLINHGAYPVTIHDGYMGWEPDALLPRK